MPLFWLPRKIWSRYYERRNAIMTSGHSYIWLSLIHSSDSISSSIRSRLAVGSLWQTQFSFSLFCQSIHLCFGLPLFLLPGGTISRVFLPTYSWSCLFDRLRGRVVKGVGHLDHVWSYGVREVVSSIPDRGNIVGWVFHPDQVTSKVFSSEQAFPSKFWIYLEHCPHGEAVITGHSAPFLYEVASHVKNCHSGHYYYLYVARPPQSCFPAPLCCSLPSVSLTACHGIPKMQPVE